MTALALQIQMWAIDRLKPYERNPRKNDKAVAQMVASITEYGFAVPVLAKSDGEVIDGHLRLKAALKMGLQEVPVIVCDSWTPEQVRAFRLMVNRSVSWADWDIEALSAEFMDLKAANFDLKLTGFDSFEFGADWGFSTEGEAAAPDWNGMPEFGQEDLLAWQTVRVHFTCAEDRDKFSALLGQTLTDKTKYVWYPKQENQDHTSVRFSTEQVDTRYPVYVISKSRWESRLTSKALENIKVPYRIVIEPQEYEQYASVIDPAKILVLPFSNLGQGSIPARNWVWEHSLSEGHARHWILDDNIRRFYRLVNNFKVPMATGITFRAVEDYVDRYANVALAGMNYQYLAKQKQKLPPFVPNTRIYSCILIDNAIPFRWRGRYNEDTDLSLRALKQGYCTVLFNAFLADKMTTMVMKGGNTDELYQGDGRLLMARSLQEQHPDVTTVVQKWGRWQHHVDYRPFRANKFILKPGCEVPEGVDEYGMVFENDAKQDTGKDSERAATSTAPAEA